jgi:hypothetical protein
MITVIMNILQLLKIAVIMKMYLLLHPRHLIMALTTAMTTYMEKKT